MARGVACLFIRNYHAVLCTVSLNIVNASTIIICEHNFQTGKYFCFIQSTSTNDQVPKADMNSHTKSCPLYFFLIVARLLAAAPVCLLLEVKVPCWGPLNLLSKCQLGPFPTLSSSSAALGFFLIASSLRALTFYALSLPVHLVLSRRNFLF